MAGSRIPKVAGTGQVKTEKIWIVVFCNRNSTKRWEALRKGHETGVKGTGRGKIRTPCLLPHKACDIINMD